MRPSRFFTVLACIGVLAACAAPAVLAQEDAPNVAESWIVHPKAGHESDFEEGFKKHVELRRQKEDPRNWSVWTPVTGDDMNRYIIRSCCHEWKDMDTYRDWSQGSGLMEDWNTNVHPHVESYAHYFAEIDIENSHWPDTTPPAYVGVTTLMPKMSSGGSVSEHIAKLSTAAKEMKWPYQWAWSRTVGGEPKVQLAVPFANYAAMKAPEKTFAQALGEKMGEEEAGALFAAWAENFESSYYTIYALRVDMSMMPEAAKAE